MKLSEWLKINGFTQSAFGAKIGASQARVSQIIERGTTDLGIAMSIEKATHGQVTGADLLAPRKKPSKAEGAAA